MSILPKNSTYKSYFTIIKGFKIHYIDSGAGKPILFVHGNPTYSYIWRNIMPIVEQQANSRVIALDLLGFGLSEKPNIPYTIELHYSIFKGFIDTLKLKKLTIVSHDWGGPLSVKYCIDNLTNVNKLILMDTFLWNLKWSDFPNNTIIPFKLLRSPLGYILTQVFNGFVSKFIPQNILDKEKVTKELLENYKRPFQTIASRRAIREFSKLVPIEGKPRPSYLFFKYIEDNIYKLNIPIKMILAKPGMGEVNINKVKILQARLPMFSYDFVEQSGHYIQEDQPEKLAKIIIKCFN